ncbi:MAG: twitching motility protein PilT [Candidatus Handelsmanbacteria bacterium RIFCSPLOWO2_12_FULL_64_10]|uniref:Ribonuclease VapC n=1 Tax=Handelsmanbacteria sp. (strain RIFCSPLOWO2_12_FULL_64_10) TaxID=1817868 RepID=A0A1F6CS87_HANXR|nr:MAG: twitching motility protein PilT [Candidatus Handelsmanbacteria bacterium RIFCSPLOWO2_12_FULL_64_10]
MSYLLDTNTCIRYLNDRDSSVSRRLRLVNPSDVILCSVVKAELYFGAYHSSRREGNLALLEDFFGRFVSLPFDDEAAKVYGNLRAQLQASGTPIGSNDLLIASIALACNVTMVTHNVREFSQVPGLQIEDWETGP